MSLDIFGLKLSIFLIERCYTRSKGYETFSSLILNLFVSLGGGARQEVKGSTFFQVWKK